MREVIKIREIDVIEIIDDGLEVYAVDLLNNKYIKLNNCYSINSALIELNENNIASKIVQENTSKKIKTLLKNNHIL